MHANKRVSRDKVAATLWTTPPRSWQQQLHNATSALRSFLRETDDQVQLQSEGSCYRLQVPPHQVDTLQFEAAVARGQQRQADGRVDDAIGEYQRAVTLWRGPVPALGGEEGDAFSARLEGMFVDAVEQLAQLKLDRGDSADTVALLGDQVVTHPLRESLRLLYMRALWRSGRSAEALTAFEAGRQVLAEELGVDPSAELRDLHTAILRGTHAEPTDNGPVGTATRSGEPGSAPVNADRAPCLLPHTPHDFTGRAKELEVLRMAASSGRTSTLTISAIDGMGGVGKTALAVRLAHEMAGDFPDGQFFVNLHGFTSGKDPLTPGQALSALLRDAGVPVESLAPDVPGRSGQWRSLMAGRRALVVLDNAVDAAQVRALLPGTAGALVIITSRRRLASLEGAVPLSVDTLPTADAISLFRHVYGDSQAQLAEEPLTEVVELCGRLPLAIRIASARFRHRSSWSIEDLAHQLRDHRTRTRLLTVDDRNVIAALSLSYRYLTPTQQNIFRLLSHHPGTEFDPYSVAALAAVPVAIAEASLEALFDDNVVLQPNAGRYQLHDLIRDAAQQLHEKYGQPADGRIAVERIVNYYLCLARAWCQPLATRPFAFAAEQGSEDFALPQRPTGVALREALERERTNFMSALRTAIRGELHHQVWQLTCALQPLLALRNYEADAMELIQFAVKSARIVDERAGECLSLYTLALATRERRQNGLAEEIFKQAIEATSQLGEAAWQAYQWADLGSAQINNGQPQQARCSFLAGLRLATEAGDQFAVHLLNNNLSVACRDLGAYVDALGHIDAAECALTSLPVEATLWLNLNRAMTLSQQGQYWDAYERFSWVLERATAARSYRRIGIALVGLSSASRALRQAEHALEAGRRALELAQQFTLREVECVSLTCIAEALLELGRPAESVDVCTQALSRSSEYGFRRYMARTHEGLAHERAQAGDLDAARRHWANALEHCPPNLVDAAGPRRHLEAPDPRAVTCVRCRYAATGPPAWLHQGARSLAGTTQVAFE